LWGGVRMIVWDMDLSRYDLNCSIWFINAICYCLANVHNIIIKLLRNFLRVIYVTVITLIIEGEDDERLDGNTEFMNLHNSLGLFFRSEIAEL